jgi:TPR repeat protein
MQACVDLADLYERGIGVAKDATYALSLQEKACKGNHGEACYNVARLNLSGVGNSSEKVASIMYVNLCGRGDHRSCYGLSELYARGRGFEQNIEQATDILEKTCTDRYVPACAQLAMLKLDENSPFADPTEGISLLQSSCKSNDPIACVKLASLLETGTYVGFNPNMAVDLYMNTCAKKQGLGCRAMGRLYEEGTLIKKNIRLSKHYYEMGCETLFDGGSCAELGVLYLKGALTGGNAEGINLLAKGCDLNYERSCRLLGDIYRNGTYVAQNNNRAFSLYKSACSLYDDGSCLLAAQLIADDKIENHVLMDSIPYFEKACTGEKKEACEEVKPIWFRHKFHTIIKNGLDSKRCKISTFNEEDPAANKVVAKIIGSNFKILAGTKKGSYEAIPQGMSFEEDEKGAHGYSYWALVEKKGMQHRLVHQEYWDTKETPDPARSFPADESTIVKQNKTILSYSRENELISLGKGCSPVLKTTKLDTRYCSEIQATIAAQLISSCTEK